MPSVERALSVGLGRPVRFASAHRELDRARLSSGVREHLGRLGAGRRQADWLRGRAALEELVGRRADTSVLRFPHPGLSITHAGTRAFALAIDGVQGVGIDFEPIGRRPGEPTWPYFLDPTERRLLAEGEDDPLRLWTVKEALFKADPHNGSRWLADYSLDDPRATQGRAMAFGPGPALHLRWTCVTTHGGWLAAACCEGETR